MSLDTRLLASVTLALTRLQHSLFIWFVACLAFQVCAASAWAQRAVRDAGTPVTMTGMLHVVHGDDFDHQRSRFFYMLEDLRTKRIYHLHIPQSVAEAQHLHTGDIMSVRGTLQGAAITLAAGGAPAMQMVAPAAAPAATGEQKTIVLVANFRDANVACSVTNIRDTMFTDRNGASIDDLYQEASFGQVSLSGDVYGPYTIDYSRTSPCDYYAWSAAAEAAAQARGVDLRQYPRRIYVLPEQNSCGYIGLGTVGGNPSRSWVFACDLEDVYGHELGHNFAAHHAATPRDEYGDISDIMGYGGIGLRHFNAPHKAQLGWLPAEQITTVTQSGTYRIAPLELPPDDTIAPHVLKIAKPDTQEFYYLSYRRPLGFDDELSSTYRDRVSVHRYKGSGAVQTYFLQSLPDGGTFSDPANGLTVTQLRHDADSATVQVAFGCRPTAPLVSLAPSTQSSRPGATVRYTVSVTNRDAAACPQTTLYLASSVPSGWTGTLSPNALTLRPGARGTAVLSVTAPNNAAAGRYVMRVNVFDNREAAHSATATAVDTIDLLGPTAPKNVAGAVVSNQVRLTWGASVDNVGVRSYTIWRNGVRRGTTTGTSFTDPVVPAGVTYTYYVVAQDAVGNNSAPSKPVTIRR